MTSYSLLRSILERLLSLIAILIIFPVWIFIIFLLYLLEGSPIFYISKRQVSNKKIILVYKFRTMIKLFDHKKFNNKYMKNGFISAPLESAYFTKIGRFLERTQLVESLQLFNILLGQMSLIGNRPLPVQNIIELKKIKDWEKRFDCPAGLTGIAQVIGKDKLKANERLYFEKLYALAYKKNKTFKIDITILLYTALLLFLDRKLSKQKALNLFKEALS